MHNAFGGARGYPAGAVLRPTQRHHQPSLPGLCPIENAVDLMSRASREARGAVFTKPQVVALILDLCGYQADRALYRSRLLEPCCGEGDFLIPAVERLLTSFLRERPAADAALLAGAVRAVEIHVETLGRARRSVAAVLRRHGVDEAGVGLLLDAWFVQEDFLLPVQGDRDDDFDFVVGNPPYVRQEQVQPALLGEYRRRYTTLYDRADLYVPFFERSLCSLSPGGVLGFICADRWTRNRYGLPLRRLVSSGYHLRHYVDLAATKPFRSDVTAYPAITVIAREPAGATTISRPAGLEAADLSGLARAMSAGAADRDRGVEVADVVDGDSPWLLDDAGLVGLIRRLESALPPLEEAGCRVGIGVATGADRAFIAPIDQLDVEPERKLPLVTTRDVRGGVVRWRGLGIINPFDEQGGVVALKDWPRFAAHVESRADVIGRRNVAKRNPATWYRTIDRINVGLTWRPKLVIPDIKAEGNVVYEAGHYYPHHNLYFVTADEWDLRALQAVLRSSVALAFVAAYSTKMRGGYFRFQAQYLRRIRLPRWADVPADVRRLLADAATSGDADACDVLTAGLYNLTAQESAVLRDLRVKGGGRA